MSGIPQRNRLPGLPTLLLIAAVVFAVPASAAGGPAAGGPAGKGVVAASNLPTFDLPPGGSVTIDFDVTVANPVPANTALVTNSATAAASNHALVASVDPDQGTGDDPNPVSDAATDTAVIADPVLFAAKTVNAGGDGVAQTSETLTYTVVVTNSGNEGGGAVVVTDSLSPLTTLVVGSVTTTQGAVTSGNTGGDTTVAVAVGELAGAGGSVTITYQVTVDASVAAGVTEVCNQAQVAGDNFTAFASDDESPDTNAMADATCVAVDAAPDFAGTKTITDANGNGSVQPGETLTYTITVANNGDQGASGVVITDAAPAGTTFDAGSVTATFTSGSGAAVVTTGNGGGDTSLQVDVDEIEAGETVEVIFTVTVDDPVAGTVISNTAQVTADGVAAFDTNTATAPIERADLTLAKDDGGIGAGGGDTIPYTLSYENASAITLTGVEITETVPAGTTFDAGASTPGWVCVPDGTAGSTCTFDLGSLTAGASGDVTFAVLVDASPGVPQVENTATIADDGANGGDATPADNTASDTTPLDQTPPTVINVDTTPDTGDGSLAECETATVELTALHVTFSEAVQNPVGDAGADDVTNPDNYLLVDPGPDLAFDTAACSAGLGGDDVAVSLAGVTYDGGSATATLALAAPLADGQYRLFVCGSTSIRDEAGNALDGDGDTTGGDDFVRTFREDAGNLFANGHFDCATAPWIEVEDLPAQVAWDGGVDVDGSPESGAAAVDNLGGTDFLGVVQCVDGLAGDHTYQLASAVRVDLAGSGSDGGSLFVERTCSFYSAAACAGGHLATTSSATVVPTDPAGAWLPFADVVETVTGTASAECGVVVRTPSGREYGVHVDALRLLDADAGEIFTDGFESGDTAAWSSTVGGP